MKNFTLFRRLVSRLIIFAFVFLVGTAVADAQYCIPTADCTAGDLIENFSTTGALANITNNTSGCSSGSYANLTSTHSMTVTPGSSFNFSVQSGSSYSQGFKIWIDWNQNQVFDVAEEMYNSVTYATTPYTGTISVPVTALPGTTRMRVRCNYNNVPVDACASQSYGEAEDYAVVVMPTTALDAGISAINSPVAPATPGLHPVSATLKNYGSTTIISATLNWSVNNVLQTPFAWSGSLAQGVSSTPVTLGSYNFPAGPATIKVWSSAPNSGVDSNAVNDTSTAMINFMSAMSGTYTIGGTGANYATITQAVNDYNMTPLSGPVVFLLNTTTFGTGETFPIMIEKNATASSVNTLTIKPATGLTVTIEGSSASSIFRINGADYVTIDGSNSSTGTRDLTISNTSTAANTAAIWISSPGTVGASYINIKNCIIAGGINSVTSVMGVYIAGTTITTSGTGAGHSYITIENNSILRSYYGIFASGVSTTGHITNLLITKNSIGSNNVADYVLFNGILVQNATAPIMTQNHIFNLKLVTSVNNAGIRLGSYVTDALIARNNITGIYSTSSGGWGAYGIDISSATGTSGIIIQNNFISDLLTSNYSTTSLVYNAFGIRITGGTNHKVYYNSVNLSGNVTSGTVAGMSAALVVTVTTATGLDVRNNVFSNSTVFGVAGSKSYAVYVPTGFVFGNINYNNYYVSGAHGILGFYGADITSLPNWMVASLQDANSVSADPTYASPVDLHAYSFSMYHTGVPISGITDDFDGDTRHATTPCIGADEFMLFTNDAGVNAMTVPVTPCPGVNDVKVLVRNYGTNPFTGVTVNWSVNSVAQTPFIFTGTIAAGASQEVTLGTYNFLASVNYSLTFSTSNPGGTADLNPANDTLAITGLHTAISGIFTIGPAPTDNYSTITAAVNDLNILGVCGPVIFNIAAGTYSEQVTIPQISGASATNTITFQSATGDSTSVILTGSGTYIMQLNGADYISIKKITVQSSATTSTKGIELLNGANYNTISNCVINMQPTTTSSVYGIYNASGLDIFNTVAYNHIINGYYGIYWYGSGTTALETGGVITGNLVEGFYYYGIHNYYQNAVTITNNKFVGALNSSTCYGINLYYCDNDIHVTGNNVWITGTSTLYGINIYYCDGTTSLRGLTANNMVVVNGTSTRYAIRNYYSSYQDVYHNSALAAGTTSTGYGLYLYNSSTTYTGHNIINNIFSNNSPSGYAAYYYNATNLISTDYNNFYSTGSNFVYSGAARADLAALQTASGKDLNSMSVDPSFLSNTDLHTYSIPLFHTGTPLVNITVDIDGDPRHPITPCIGADEYILYNNDAGVSMMTEPLSVCGGIVTSIKVKVKNFGIQSFTGATVNWKVNGVTQTPVSFTSSLAPGANQEVTLGTYTFLNGLLYDLVFWTSNPGSAADQNPANDTLKILGFRTAMTGTYTIGAGTGYDYSTISAAVSDLNSYGVCGPTIFNIAAGTYTERVTLNAIVGASAINTVTFQGTTTSNQDVVIEYNASGTADNWTVRFDGTDYTTFKNLTIKALNTTYGRVIEMINGANNNTIENSRLISAGASSSTTGCVYDAGTLNHNNAYRNNYMSGGYYSIYTYGISTSSWQIGTIIEGNDIVGSYYYPIYAYYHDGIQIINNRIYDGVSPYSYGIANYYPNNAYRVTGNEVYITSTSSSASYGIRDYYGNYYSYNASPTGYGIVANNMVGITGGTAANYGIYAYYSNGTQYLYNSFLMEGGSTSSYCLYQGNTTSNTLGQTFINNTMTNRVGGYAAYFGTTASVTTSNYNNFYSSASNLAYWGVLTPDLASLQVASGKDQNSISLNAPHKSFNNLRLNGLQLSGKGTYLTQVTTDIDGNPRGTIPTIGAQEIAILPFDGGVASLNSPTSAMTINEGDVIPVNVVVANYGTSTITNLSVAYSVNNGTPVVTSFTPNILTNTTASFTLPTYTSPAGPVTVAFYTIVAGDTNYFNDTASFSYFALPLYDAEMVAILPITEGCGLGLDTISVLIANRGVTAINGNITASYKLAGGLTSVTQPVTAAIPIGDTILFVFNTPADFSVTGADSTFTIIAWVDLLNDNMLVNDTATRDIVSMHLPAPPVLTSTHVPYGTPATLVATSAYDVSWYDSETSTTVLATGNTFVTPQLTDTATYWADVSSSTLSTGSFTSPGGLTGGTTCGGGFMVDVTALSSNITLEALDIHCNLTGAQTVNFFYRVGTWVGFASDQTAWTPWGTYTVNSLGANTATYLAITPLTIPQGATYAIYWQVSTQYGSLSVNTTYSNNDIAVLSGMAHCTNWDGCCGPRQWNGTLYYSIGVPGCTSPRVPVTANIIPTVTLLTADTTICEGSSVNLFVALTGTPPWTLEVSDGTASTMVPGITIPTFAVPVTPTTTTTYSIINIADYTNTFFPDNAQVTITVQPAPVVSITGAADTICETSAVVLDAGSGFASYLWSDASTNQTLTVTGASIGAGNSGTFSVTVTNSFGCEGSGQVKINVIDCSDIDELFSNSTVYVWPNPNSGIFSMKTTGIMGEVMMNLTKVTGELVKTENLILGNETTTEFNLGNLAAGVYYIKLITKYGTITKKVMIR